MDNSIEVQDSPRKACGIDIGAQDRHVLRELAQKVSELANRPIEDEKRKLWYKHNDLVPVRPLIFCDLRMDGMRLLQKIN